MSESQPDRSDRVATLDGDDDDDGDDDGDDDDGDDDDGDDDGDGEGDDVEDMDSPDGRSKPDRYSGDLPTI